MNSELVSVIIPTYSRAEFLRGAIESVLAQTYTGFELLILDNCSPDHTPEVVASFKDPRIKYLRHQCNIGALANWTYGLHLSTGKYIAFLCDDDFYKPEFLESYIRAFSRFENIDAVFSNYDICDDSGNMTSSSLACYEFDKVICSRELVACIVKREWHIGATLYKKDVVVRFWEESLRAGKACVTALNVRIALDPQYRVTWICDKGLVYRRHANQDSVLEGEQVLIGHICACTEPLQFGDFDEYRGLLGEGAAWAYNILGRVAWDAGRIKLARRYFVRELSASPFRKLTWMRLLRSFVMKPKTVSARR